MRASALVTGHVVRGRPDLPARRALELMEAAGAVALAVGRGGVVRRVEAERVVRWGLDRLPAGHLMWSGVAAVASTAPESTARRLLALGAPMVLVTESGRPAGLVERERVRSAPVESSLGRRLEAADDPATEARLWLLRAAGKTAESVGESVHLVGGAVRDLLVGRSSPDIDLAVEGDGIRFARRLSDEVGGHLVDHPAFGTASIEGARSPGGTPLGRIDVASTRRERYEAPGQLPRVRPAGIEADLARRDFSVNAMALALAPGTFGRLLDPHGGQADLRRRRLRPLHPLSFIEDPTRIFRAARYGTRLGLRLDGSGHRALAAALCAAELTVGFPALSGPRLAAEVRLLAGESSSWAALERLARWQALRLWDREVRATTRTGARLRAARRLQAWGRRRGYRLDGFELVLVGVLVDQDPHVARRCLTRLGLTGAPLAALAGAVGGGPATAQALAARGLPASAVAARLRGLPEPVLLGAWLLGGPRVRQRVQWFLAGGRDVRARLDGEKLLALGIRAGPDMATVLAALRDGRLDGRLRSTAQERALVRALVRARPAGEKGDPR